MEVCDLMLRYHTDEVDQRGSSDNADSRVKATEKALTMYMDCKDFESERCDEKVFKEVIVHLDMKGAPPTFAFFKRFVSFIGERYGKLVTGILLELEDTFPYEGYLTPLRGLNFYSKEQLYEIQELAKKYKLQIIPLIQTFGHLEFALKRERFAHLREQQYCYQSLCPLKGESKEFVLSMIDQNVKLFGESNLEVLHLGADEVFNLASCAECQMFVEESGRAQLYSCFMTKICKAVKKRYPGMRIMLWDDMYRNHSFAELQHLQPQGSQSLFEPCIWAYSGN